MVTKTFEGQPDKSVEEAIKNTIEQDPRGDEGTDIFHYRVAETMCDFGDFTRAYTYKVKIERINVK